MRGLQLSKVLAGARELAQAIPLYRRVVRSGLVLSGLGGL